MAIFLDFQDTINKADKIQSYSSKIVSKTNGSIAKYEHTIGTCWKGDSSKAFCNKYKKNNDKIYSSANKIKNTAEALGKNARFFKNVEEVGSSLWG